MSAWSRFLFSAVAAFVLVSCSSSEFGQIAQVAARAGGMSEEESRRIGQTTQTFGEAVLPVDYEQERAIGGGVAIKAFEEFGPYYDDPALGRYVTLVGKGIALTCERPDLPYAFAVIDNETPNAFAGPGGYIFITVGTLRNLKDESQLAAILAHEIAHVCKRHAIQTLQRGKLLQGVAQGGSIADPRNAEVYDQAIGAMEDTLFNKGLDQRLEFEADLVGTEYAAMAGYNPWGMREYLDQLRQMRGVSGGWFQTHPALDTRIERLDAFLNGQLADYRNLPRAKERFEKNVTQRLRPAK